MRDLENLLKLANSIGEETKQNAQLHMSDVDKNVEKMKHHQSLIEEPKKPKVENPFEIDQLLANLGIHPQTIPKEQSTQPNYQQPVYQQPKQTQQQQFVQQQQFAQQPTQQPQQNAQPQPKKVNLAQVAAAVPPRKRVVPTGVQQVKTISEAPKPTVAEFEQNAKLELERLSQVTYQLAQQQPKQIDEILSKKELTIEDSQNLAAIISQVNDHIESQSAAQSEPTNQSIINDADDFLSELGQDFDDFDDDYADDFDSKPKPKRLKGEKKKKNKKKKVKENAEELAKKPLIQRIIQWIVIIVLAIIIGAVASHFVIQFLFVSLSSMLPITTILQL
jgi:hypothetical protein